MARLGVNVDHVATLRQARGEGFPDVVAAAREAERGGAQGIVFHLREDRRHIQDADVAALRRAVRTKLDFEMAATPEMLRICLRTQPELATLVPEKRRELTTEGGLDVAGDFAHIARAVERLQRGGIPAALFVDPSTRQIEASARTGAQWIELHTGDYARAFASRRRAAAALARLRGAARLAARLGLRVNAGHGLDYRNAAEAAALPHVVELNIGHSIVARAITVGLRQAVREMATLIQ